MHREYHKWFSRRLERDMELLVFGHAGARVLVFPTRRGRFFDFENFGLVEALADKLESGHLQLFCVDSIDADSLYSKEIPPHERVQRHLCYEEYILEEVLPFTRLKNPQPYMIALGCSFGAYHAVNIALRHPQWFGKVVALSGRYDLSTPVEFFRGLFDSYYDETIYYNTPSHFLPNLHDECTLALLRRMHFLLAIGREDPFLENNQALSATLAEKQIPHDLYIWEGRAHQAADWQEMVKIYL
ncbi:esterase family protein [Larkinella insperata]|uniref:Esterase family protein n=1 Tax=Larkinella insperata TaxID=332158 RepID=A0ABW3QAB0_9BACT|nr:alpha/beta fold hydrolase [Larkinella insperata]